MIDTIRNCSAVRPGGFAKSIIFLCLLKYVVKIGIAIDVCAERASSVGPEANHVGLGNKLSITVARNAAASLAAPVL